MERIVVDWLVELLVEMSWSAIFEVIYWFKNENQKLMFLHIDSSRNL